MSTSTKRLSPAAVAAGVRELVAGLDDASLAEALGAYGLIDGIVEAARSRRLALAMKAAEEAGQDPLKVAKSAARLGRWTTLRTRWPLTRARRPTKD